MVGAEGGRRWTVVLAAAAVFAATACGGSSPTPTRESATPSPSTTPSPSPSPMAPVAVSVASPVDGATDVPTGLALAFRGPGVIRAVSLTAADGTVVRGALQSDGRTWVPAVQLTYGTTYSVAVTAANAGGEKTVRTRFTTMGRPGGITGADLYVRDGDVVGVGMPIVVEFTRRVADDRRAAIERRLFVRSTPQVEGAWHWFSDSEVHFRPKEYWPSGTKVSVRLAIGGMPMGFGRYGKRDRFATFTVGSAVLSKVVNASKTMYVYKDGVLLRKFPISLGKSSTPTSSGTMVAMDKQESMTFDSGTFGVPANSPGGYRRRVYWDVRFTWRGEFVHSAPWSVGDQGRRNVSHGCVNAAPTNARWFYELTKKGDVIQVVGTERRVGKGDGWTDWSMTWAEYQAGSALR